MKSYWKIIAIFVLAIMVLTACATPAATEEPVVPEEPTEPAEPAMTYKAGQELTDAYAGKYSGTVVTMQGPFTDADAVKFDNSVKAFEEATGIDIQYTGSKEFEANISIIVEGGNPPDIVDFPQPGLLKSLVAKGYGVDLTDVINQDWLKENYNQSWLDMSMIDSPDGEIMAGVWGRVNGKSLVWYPKKENMYG